MASNEKIETRYMFSEAELVGADSRMEGFCLKCRAVQGCVEPDTRNRKCDECKELAVWGASEIGCIYPITMTAGRKVDAPKPVALLGFDRPEDAPVTRSAPQWAWDIIDQTLALDAQSGAFSRDLREDIARAIEAMDEEADQ